MTTTGRKAHQGKLRTTKGRVEVEMAHLYKRGVGSDDVDVATIDAPNVTLRAFDPDGLSANGEPRRVFGSLAIHRVVEVEVRPTHVDNGTQINVTTDGTHHGRVTYSITLFDLPLDTLVAAVALAAGKAADAAAGFES